MPYKIIQISYFIFNDIQIFKDQIVSNELVCLLQNQFSININSIEHWCIRLILSN